MNIVGYDDLESFIIENSWGTSWGDNGYGLISYAVMLKDTNDCWVCTGFDGLEFPDEWTDDETPLEVYNETINFYNDSTEVMDVECKHNETTGPYKYEWGIVVPYGAYGGYYPAGKMWSKITTYKVDKEVSQTILSCTVRDSSTIPKTKYFYYTINRVQGNKPIEPVNPEPTDPINPIPEDKSKSKLLIYIGIGIAVIGLIALAITKF